VELDSVASPGQPVLYPPGGSVIALAALFTITKPGQRYDISLEVVKVEL
jgi:hypothetical protein